VNANTALHHSGDDVWVFVEKYVEGAVVEVDGTSAHIHLRQPTGRSLVISATPQKLSELADTSEHQSVFLRVLAEENLKTNALRNLKLISIEIRSFVWDEDALNAMVEKGTQAWADVPDNWLETLRGH